MSLALFTILTADLVQQAKKGARYLSGAFFIVLLSACATTPQTKALLSQPLATLPNSTELTDVPFFPQKAYQCGPAALATMLANVGKQVTTDALVSKVYIPERRGSLQLEMVATARSYGLIAYQLAPQLEAILEEINAGNPVLIFQNLAFNWAPQWHYAVVVGYDLAQQQLILRSGTHKRHHVSLATFERTWQRGKHWAYTIMPPDRVPQTATPFNYIKATNALMKTGQTTAALTAYKTASQTWSNDAISFMALGNALYNVGQYQQATTAFSQAAQLAPKDAQAWNNLAYALAANHCQTAAEEAIQCALTLAPEDANLQSSFDELTHQPTSSTAQCTIPRCPLVP